MTMPPNGSEMEKELFGLCDQLLDGKLSEDGKLRLERLVLEQSEARRLYVEYMQLNASLRQQSAALGEVSLESVLREFPMAPVPKRKVPWFLKIAAAFILGTGVPSAIWFAGENNYVATLVEAPGARWENSRFSTELGSKFGAGRIRLAEGLARFVFRSGVELTLEGPAEFELSNGGLCRLNSGALVAHVPPAGRGFTVQTTHARLIDLGTQFGIRADPSGLASVRVLEGNVELRHNLGGEPMHLSTGQMAFVTPRDLARVERNDEELRHPSSILGDNNRIRSFTHEITTATGTGAAAYVTSPGTKIHFSDTLLLLKNARTELFLRKAILRFDLAPLKEMPIESARLTFNFESTGFGFASLNRDTQFAVYGVTDDSLDYWAPGEVKWETLPAYSPDAGSVDLTKAVKVGSFVLPRGVSRGAYYIEGEDLARYLEQDLNRQVTLIVVCETQQSAADSVVFGIAGNNHPTLPPPTLRLRTTP